MNNREVIRLAREAGFHEWYTLPEIHPEHVAIVERFAALVAAQEREECAEECEAFDDFVGHQCAAAIRARSKE